MTKSPTYLVWAEWRTATFSIQRTGPVHTMNKLALSDEVADIDPADLNTPDSWIPREPLLIRLTGDHPLNAEPPADILLEQGFITPSKLHYVRNHGRVPKINDFKLEIGGLISNARSFTLEELKAMPSLRFPVTFACDGNRRRELNALKHSKGFGWGAGAVSTSIWKGVSLRYLIETACGGMKRPDENTPLFICFDGSKEEDLQQGVYGTSAPAERLLDPLADVIIAYEMNDSPLPPDHGAPLRLIIPGFVGGRNVKWLRKITVSTKESTSPYHHHDNRVLPPEVTSFSEEPMWADKSEYTLYELNVNSAIVTPLQFEWIPIDNPADEYRVSGYAYSGGGRKVVRVELSLNGGKTWEQCKRSYGDIPPRHGCKYWTWCLWECKLPKWRLLTAQELIVRAADESLSIQPEHPTWNLLGMMNNSWYRVKLEVSPPVLSAGSRAIRSRMSQSGTERALQYMLLLSHEHGGEQVLQARDAVVAEERLHQRKSAFATEKQPSVGCYHPLMPIQMGGWMLLNHKGPLHAHMRKGACVVSQRALKQIPADELAKHKSPDDCWVVIDGMVCDLTNYLGDHPGGKHTLQVHAGRDVTDLFYDIHGEDAYEIKERFAIGVLSQPKGVQSAFETAKKYGSSIRPDVWQELVLKETVCESHDTIRLRLQFPDKRKVGIPVGQHLLIGADIGGEFVVRPYTPISPVDLRHPSDTVELLVKVYKPHGNRPGGKMSMFMDAMKPGAKLKVKGPAGHIVYAGKGTVVVHATSLRLDQISFIAGGTGITPVYQFIKHILDDPDDNTELALLYSNRTPEDMLMRKELDELAEKNKGKFHLWYTITQETDSAKEWKYGVGRVNGNMISETLLAPTPRSAAFVVGPPPMIEQACLPFLHRMGYTEENLFEF